MANPRGNPRKQITNRTAKPIREAVMVYVTLS
jgi:hypothetical protein